MNTRNQHGESPIQLKQVVLAKRKRSIHSPPTKKQHAVQDPIREKVTFYNHKRLGELSPEHPSLERSSKSMINIRRAIQKKRVFSKLGKECELSTDDSGDESLIGTKIVVTDCESTESDDELNQSPLETCRKLRKVDSPLRINPDKKSQFSISSKSKQPYVGPNDLSSDSDEGIYVPSFESQNNNNSILSDSIIVSTDDEEFVGARGKSEETDSEAEFNEEEFKLNHQHTEEDSEEDSEVRSEGSECTQEEEQGEEPQEEEIVEDNEIIDSDDEEAIELDSESELSEVEVISTKTTKKKKQKRVPISAEQLKSSENGWSYDATNDHYVLPIGDDLAGFATSPNIFEKLYHHQQIGLKWLAERHMAPKFRGGLLADQMGLGKTIQISALIHGLFLCEKASRVLIICPNSVLGNWQRELSKWTDGCIQGIVIFHQVGANKSTNKKRKGFVDQFNRYAKNGGAVMLSTYCTIANHVEFLKNNFVGDSLLDSIVLDEAHKIKNKDAKCSIALKTLPSKSRFALTGTPIMNRLAELYAIFSWIFDEELLGSNREFNDTYAIAINNSTKRDATAYDKIMGNNAADALRETIQPYLMMRDKNSVLSIDNQLYKKEDGSVTAKIGQKNDLVVWCTLTEEQSDWYRDYLSSDAVKEVLNKTLNPLVGITVLKQICDHNLMCTGYGELLEKKKEELRKEMTEQAEDEDIGDFIDDSEANLLTESATPMSMNLDMDDMDEKKKKAMERKLRQAQEQMIKERIRSESIEAILSSSVKAQLVKQIVQISMNEGHKVLIFSQYTRMLDIIGVILKSMKIKYNRIDGSVTKYQERLNLVDSFNQKKNIKCFLLSSQAGGVGLNLTAANRVILVEPNFNPCIDEQAIDRCYRIGQRQNVIVYRLICCSTIEEYIYKRQISKTTVSRTAVIASNQYRYLRQTDLLEMFTLGDTTVSETCYRFNKIHEKDRRDADGLEEHITFLKGIPFVVGVSDHDVLFCNAADDFNDEHAKIEELRRQAQIERVQQIRNLRNHMASSIIGTGGLPHQMMFRLSDLFSSTNFEPVQEEGMPGLVLPFRAQ